MAFFVVFRFSYFVGSREFEFVAARLFELFGFRMSEVVIWFGIFLLFFFIIENGRDFLVEVRG